MSDFVAENFYGISALMIATAISWCISIFFASKKTLGIFFGAWYLTLGFFMAIAKWYSGTCLPTFFILVHLSFIYILDKIFKAYFSWNKYLLFALSSFVFGSFFLYCLLEAAINTGHK